MVKKVYPLHLLKKKHLHFLKVHLQALQVLMQEEQDHSHLEEISLHVHSHQMVALVHPHHGLLVHQEISHQVHQEDHFMEVQEDHLLSMEAQGLFKEVLHHSKEAHHFKYVPLQPHPPLFWFCDFFLLMYTRTIPKNCEPCQFFILCSCLSFPAHFPSPCPLVFLFVDTFFCSLQ